MKSDDLIKRKKENRKRPVLIITMKKPLSLAESIAINTAVTRGMRIGNATVTTIIVTAHTTPVVLIHTNYTETQENGIGGSGRRKNEELLKKIAGVKHRVNPGSHPLLTVRLPPLTPPRNPSGKQDGSLPKPFTLSAVLNWLLPPWSYASTIFPMICPGFYTGCICSSAADS